MQNKYSIIYLIHYTKLNDALLLLQHLYINNIIIFNILILILISYLLLLQHFDISIIS